MILPPVFPFELGKNPSFSLFACPLSVEVICLPVFFPDVLAPGTGGAFNISRSPND